MSVKSLYIGIDPSQMKSGSSSYGCIVGIIDKEIVFTIRLSQEPFDIFTELEVNIAQYSNMNYNVYVAIEQINPAGSSMFSKSCSGDSKLFAGYKTLSLMLDILEDTYSITTKHSIPLTWMKKLGLEPKKITLDEKYSLLVKQKKMTESKAKREYRKKILIPKIVTEEIEFNGFKLTKPMFDGAAIAYYASLHFK